jgi:hypothetical protein
MLGLVPASLGAGHLDSDAALYHILVEHDEGVFVKVKLQHKLLGGRDSKVESALQAYELESNV